MKQLILKLDLCFLFFCNLVNNTCKWLNRVVEQISQFWQKFFSWRDVCKFCNVSSITPLFVVPCSKKFEASFWSFIASKLFCIFVHYFKWCIFITISIENYDRTFSLLRTTLNFHSAPRTSLRTFVDSSTGSALCWTTTTLWAALRSETYCSMSCFFWSLEIAILT